MAEAKDPPPGDLYAVPLVLQLQPPSCEDMEDDCTVTQQYTVSGWFRWFCNHWNLHPISNRCRKGRHNQLGSGYDTVLSYQVRPGDGRRKSFPCTTQWCTACVWRATVFVSK